MPIAPVQIHSDSVPLSLASLGTCTDGVLVFAVSKVATHQLCECGFGAHFF